MITLQGQITLDDAVLTLVKKKKAKKRRPRDETRPVAKGDGVEEVGRPPALIGHFFADCSSANILNIVRL